MKLKELRIDGFRSVKETVRLLIDPRVTVLIGANDHGKTNLLEGIRALNSDRALKPEDENWDSIGQGKPIIEYDFELDTEEVTEVRGMLVKAIKAASPSQSAGTVVLTAAASAQGSGAATVIANTDSSISQGPGETLSLSNFPEIELVPVIPERITFSKGTGQELRQLQFEKYPEIAAHLKKLVPRVELFAAADQLMDIVTLTQLEDPMQEFMQGIFRYAGIWNERKGLFRQDPATARRLEQASEEFTNRIRQEWKQGENLSFRFQHAGQNGNQIELMIRDPAVSNRFVRPSERSAGFSAFFTMNMRLLARTEANPANKYLFLFDEPGTALHPAGQVNLQKVFERLSQKDQIVYATHSLFMVNHNRPERNRVISKDTGGTKTDQKPYLRNWRAVREALGLILAGNFFISDTTLLVEGESDAMYIGAMLAGFDRAGLIDIDLNLFSVQWAGNSRDYEPMARLMLEEGRHVVAVMDGDKAGNDLRKSIETLNGMVNAGRVIARGPVEIVQLDRYASIEDILPLRRQFLGSVVESARNLVANGFLEVADGVELNHADRIIELEAEHGNVTLGRYIENVSGRWFKKKKPMSKLTIAHGYCGSLEVLNLRERGVAEVPKALVRIIEALRLESKLGEETVVIKETPEAGQLN